MQSKEDFHDLVSIPQAKVPIIKVYIDNIQFDILFALVDEPKGIYKMLKQSNVAKSQTFSNLCKDSQDSLLGRISCQNLLNHVHNRQTF